MRPPVRGSTAAAAGLSSTSPAGTQVGDLVIVGTWEQAGAGSPTHTLDSGSGYVEILSWAHNDGSTDGRLSVAYKIATSGGAVSYAAYTSSDGTTVRTGLLVLKAGSYDVADIVAAASSLTNANAPNPPSLTLDEHRDYLILAFAGWFLPGSATVGVTPPTNYAEQWEVAGASTSEFSLATRGLSAPQASVDPGAFGDDTTPSGTAAMTVGIPNAEPSDAYYLGKIDENFSTSATQLILTVPAAGVPLGSLVTVCGGQASAGVISSVTDSKGNTYVVDATVGGGGTGSSLVSSVLTAALVSGDTITVNLSGAAAACVAHAHAFAPASGKVWSASPIDKTHTGTSTGTSPSSGATASTTVADELVVGAFGWSNASVVFEPGSGYTGTSGVFSITAGQTSEMIYKVVGSTGVQTADGALDTSILWNAVVGTYKMETAEVPLLLGDIPAASAAHGIDLSQDGADALLLGDVPAASAAHGIDLTAGGPDALLLGDIPSAEVVRGIDLSLAALDLDLGDIPSAGVVNGIDLALSPAYTPTTWVDDSVPSLDETNLNKLTDELRSQAEFLDIAETLPTWADGVRPYLTEGVPWNEMERVCDAAATALGLSYTPTDWLAGWSPPRNADNLNHLEQQAAANRDAINGDVEMLPVFVGETGFYQLNTDGGNDGVLLANAVELESRYGTCTLQSLSIRVANAAGNLYLGLYDNDGPSGGPGTLLATTAEFAPAAGWNTEPVLSEVDLAPGTYWIAHQPDDAALTYGAMNVVASSNEGRWYAHSGALPSTFSASPTSGDARWAVYATFASTTETKPADPAAPSPPSQASAEGFTTLAFQDEFEYYDREKWADHPFWGEAPPADSIYISSSSVISLNSQIADGHPDVHLAAREIITGGNEQTFQFGYFEARMKWNIDEGILPAFWLSSLANALNAGWPSDPPEGVLNAEIDVIEAQYDDAQLYYGTLHENTGETYGGGATDNTAGGTYDAGVDLDAGFHTYGCLWTATEVTWFFDDVEVLTTAPFADTDQPQFILLSMMPNNTWTGDPANAVGDLIAEFDWVRCWQ